MGSNGLAKKACACADLVVGLRGRVKGLEIVKGCNGCLVAECGGCLADAGASGGGEDFGFGEVELDTKWFA